jgi:hypothetical protein
VSAEPIEHVADYSSEPRWLEISWKYEELEKTTKQLSEDIRTYRDALGVLDAAGSNIQIGKERVALLKEAIAQMEETK